MHRSLNSSTSFVGHYVVINRTLIYTLLSGCLFLLFWVSDKVLEGLVGSVLFAAYSFSSLSRYASQFSGVGSTLIVGKSVSPIHKRSEEFINRMFYKDKYIFAANFRNSLTNSQPEEPPSNIK